MSKIRAVCSSGNQVLEFGTNIVSLPGGIVHLFFSEGPRWGGQLPLKNQHKKCPPPLLSWEMGSVLGIKPVIRRLHLLDTFDETFVTAPGTLTFLLAGCNIGRGLGVHSISLSVCQSVPKGVKARRLPSSNGYIAMVRRDSFPSRSDRSGV